MNWHRVRALAMTAVVSSLSCGCAMYSPARDKQGQTVQKAWSQVDLTAQIEVPRKNLSALLTEQLTLEDQIWQQRRDDVARQMVSSMTVADFKLAVRQRLHEVADSSADGATIRLTTANMQKSQERLDEARRSLKIGGITPPSCSVAGDAARLASFRDKFAKPDANLKVQLWDGLAPDFVAACSQADEAAKKMLEIGGAVGAARLGLAQIRTDIERQKSSVDKLQKDLDDAEAAYQKQVDEAKAKPNAVQAELDAAAKKVEAVRAKVASNSFAQSFISKQRLDALQEFLATYDDVEGGKNAAAGSNRAAIALASFPDLAAKARQTLADVRKPDLVPLVIQKNIEQQKLEQAQRDANRQEQLADLLQAQVDNLLAQFDAYQQVQRGLDAAWKGKPDSASLRDVLQPYSDRSRQSVRDRKTKTWEAAARFLDAEGRLHAENAKNRYRITALAYEETLTIAESGVNQWKVLIDPSVELMADYGASGTKTSDIKGLIDTLMLLGIAIGVN